MVTIATASTADKVKSAKEKDRAQKMREVLKTYEPEELAEDQVEDALAAHLDRWRGEAYERRKVDPKTVPHDDLGTPIARAGGVLRSLDGVKPADATGRLDLSARQLQAVPSRLQRFTRLRELSLVGNGLSYVPHWLGEAMTELTVLNLGDNALSALPDLTRLPLIHLGLSYNRFSSTARLVGSLPAPSLRSLELGYNQLVSLKAALRPFAEAADEAGAPRFAALLTLSLAGNMCCAQPDYRARALAALGGALPRLRVLDGTDLSAAAGAAAGGGGARRAEGASAAAAAAAAPAPDADADAPAPEPESPRPPPAHSYDSESDLSAGEVPGSRLQLELLSVEGFPRRLAEITPRLAGGAPEGGADADAGGAKPETGSPAPAEGEWRRSVQLEAAAFDTPAQTMCVLPWVGAEPSSAQAEGGQQPAAEAEGGAGGGSFSSGTPGSVDGGALNDPQRGAVLTALQAPMPRTDASRTALLLPLRAQTDGVRVIVSLREQWTPAAPSAAEAAAKPAEKPSKAGGKQDAKAAAAAKEKAEAAAAAAEAASQPAQPPVLTELAAIGIPCAQLIDATAASSAALAEAAARARGAGAPGADEPELGSVIARVRHRVYPPRRIRSDGSLGSQRPPYTLSLAVRLSLVEPPPRPPRAAAYAPSADGEGSLQGEDSTLSLDEQMLGIHRPPAVRTTPPPR